MALATIIQIAPVYVSFTMPQRSLQDIRRALAEKTATIEALMPGSTRPASGEVTMIENTVDAATGMATIRATMPNTDEALWPGTLVTTQLILRVEDAVVVPSVAVQVSQTGSFVFVVKNEVASVQPITVDRVIDGRGRHRIGPGGRRNGRDRRPSPADQWRAGHGAGAQGRFVA